MIAHVRPAVVLFALLTVVCGAVYPAAVTVAAQSLFPAKAGGSLVEVDGTIVGSSLIGQCFADPAYFWGRLSATGCNGAGSGGSNYGVQHEALVTAASDRARALGVAAIPADLLTASASGIDPHISPEAATVQVSRIAAARGLDETAVRAIVASHVEGRTLGFLGEPRVNVLALNLTLGPP